MSYTVNKTALFVLGATVEFWPYFTNDQQLLDFILLHCSIIYFLC